MSVRNLFSDKPQGRYAPVLKLDFRTIEETPADLAHYNFREQRILKADLAVLFRANNAQLDTARNLAFKRMAYTLYREQIEIAHLLQAAMMGDDREECEAQMTRLLNSMEW